MKWGATGKEAALADIQAQVGTGWHQLLETLTQDLLALGWDGTVMQVKEKFGGLRFYISHGTDEIYVCIDAAEAKSFTVCEDCGDPGAPGGKGWIRTLCEGCRATWNSR